MSEFICRLCGDYWPCVQASSHGYDASNRVPKPHGVMAGQPSVDALNGDDAQSEIASLRQQLAEAQGALNEHNLRAEQPFDSCEEPGCTRRAPEKSDRCYVHQIESLKAACAVTVGALKSVLPKEGGDACVHGKFAVKCFVCSPANDLSRGQGLPESVRAHLARVEKLERVRAATARAFRCCEKMTTKVPPDSVAARIPHCPTHGRHEVPPKVWDCLSALDTAKECGSPCATCGKCHCYENRPAGWVCDAAKEPRR